MGTKSIKLMTCALPECLGISTTEIPASPWHTYPEGASASSRERKHSRAPSRPSRKYVQCHWRRGILVCPVMPRSMSWKSGLSSHDSVAIVWSGHAGLRRPSTTVYAKILFVKATCAEVLGCSVLCAQCCPGRCCAQLGYRAPGQSILGNLRSIIQ